MNSELYVNNGYIVQKPQLIRPDVITLVNERLHTQHTYIIAELINILRANTAYRAKSF